MNGAEEKDILQLARGRIDCAEFFKRYIPDGDCRQHVLDLLVASSNARDAGLIDLSLVLGSRLNVFSNEECFIPVLTRIGLDLCHTRHSHVVGALEDVKSEATLPLLEKLVTLMPAHYEDSDNPYELARRALWAIHKLQTPRSAASLASFKTNPDPVIADLATRIEAGRD